MDLMEQHPHHVLVNMIPNDYNLGTANKNVAL
jgi:hypothetical protein